MSEIILARQRSGEECSPAQQLSSLGCELNTLQRSIERYTAAAVELSNTERLEQLHALIKRLTEIVERFSPLAYISTLSHEHPLLCACLNPTERARAAQVLNQRYLEFTIPEMEKISGIVLSPKEREELRSVLLELSGSYRLSSLRDPTLPRVSTDSLREILQHHEVRKRILHNCEPEIERMQVALSIFGNLSTYQSIFSLWLDLFRELQSTTRLSDQFSDSELAKLNQARKDLMIRQGEPIGEFISWLQEERSWECYQTFCSQGGRHFDPAVMVELGKALQIYDRSNYDREYDRFLGGYLLTKFGATAELPDILVEALRPWGDRRPSPMLESHSRHMPYLSDYLTRMQVLEGQTSPIFQQVRKLLDANFLNVRFEQICRNPREEWPSQLKALVDTHLLALVDTGKSAEVKYALAALRDIKGSLSPEIQGALLRFAEETKDQDIIEDIGDLFALKVHYHTQSSYDALLKLTPLASDCEAAIRWLGVLIPRSLSQLSGACEVFSPRLGISKKEFEDLLSLLGKATSETRSELKDLSGYLSRRSPSHLRANATYLKGSAIMCAYISFASDPRVVGLLQALAPFGYEPKATDAPILVKLASNLEDFKSGLRQSEGLPFLDNLHQLTCLPSSFFDECADPLAIALGTGIRTSQGLGETLSTVGKLIIDNPQLASSLVPALWHSLDSLNVGEPMPYGSRIGKLGTVWGDETKEICLLFGKASPTQLSDLVTAIDPATFSKSRLEPTSLVNLRENLLSNAPERITVLTKNNKDLVSHSSESHRLLFLPQTVLNRFLESPPLHCLLELVSPMLPATNSAPGTTSHAKLMEDLSFRADRLAAISKNSALILLVENIVRAGGAEILCHLLAYVNNLPNSSHPQLLSYCNALSVAIGEDSAAHDQICERLRNNQVDTLLEFRDIIREPVLNSLSERLPEALVRSSSLDTVIEIATIFLPYSKQFRGSSDDTWMKGAVVAELLNCAKGWKSGEPRAVERVFRHLSTLSELDSASKVISLKEKKIGAAKRSPVNLLNSSGIASWRGELAMHAHVIRDLTMEDRLRSLQTQISQLTHPDHMSSRVLEMLSLARPEELPREIAAEIKTELLHPSSKEHLDKLRKQQIFLKKWQPLWWIINKAPRLIEDHLSKMQELRSELAGARDLIIAMGFDFNDSFATHTYLGELRILKEKIGEQEWQTESNAKKLKVIEDVIARWEVVERETNSTLGVLAKTASDARALISIKDQAIERISEKLGNKALSVSQANTQLSEVLLLPLAQLEKAIQSTTDLELLATPEALKVVDSIYSASTTEEKSQVLIYRPECRLSRALSAFVGQCLDYRSGSNSQYNLAWCEDQFEPVVAVDEDGSPRVNFVTWIAALCNDRFLYTGSGDYLNHKGVSATLVIDPVYTPDGSPVTWDKIEGALEYSLMRANESGTTLFIPDRVISSYKDDFDRWRAALNLKAKKRKLDLRIVLGANEGAYLESKEWSSYQHDTSIEVSGWLLKPKKPQVVSTGDRNESNLKQGEEYAIH